MLINLISDTQTRPVEEMRAAMAAAEVGDEQRSEDPTVNMLCERVAALLDPDTVETNIAVFQLPDAPGFCQRLEAEHGVRMGTLGPDLVRAVTHHDVDTAGVRHAVAAVTVLLSPAR
ncbi:MAG: beta-eliminating lyase-related protein [Pseudonocardiaceae bacterium]